MFLGDEKGIPQTMQILNCIIFADTILSLISCIYTCLSGSNFANTFMGICLSEAGFTTSVQNICSNTDVGVQYKNICVQQHGIFHVFVF